jgi:dienelactone hydrolase
VRFYNHNSIAACPGKIAPWTKIIDNRIRKINASFGRNKLQNRKNVMCMVILIQQLRFVIPLFGLLLAGTARAEVVELKLPSGIVATAEYRPGKPSHPAVVLIHGFLQTRNFPLIAALTTDLADSGYTVLAPTLSLGVNRRAKSLACEAVHTHTLEGDAAEIAAWSNWLIGKGHKDIVLVGHSVGTSQITVYLATPRYPQPKMALLVSMSDNDNSNWAYNRDNYMAQARKKIQSGDKSIDTYALSFCKKYVATPQSYLSYTQWDRSRVLKALKTSSTPVYVLLGRNDDRMNSDWPDKLKASGINVTLMEDTNHYFEGQSEFKLLDDLEARLKSLIKTR